MRPVGLRAHEHQETLQPRPSTNDVTISTSIDMKKTGSPLLTAHDGIGLAAIPTNTIAPRSENSINVDARNSEPDIDFADTTYPESYPNPNIEPDVNTINQNFTTQVKTVEKEDSLHPQVTTYAIGIGATLGIGLALSFVMAPYGVMAMLVKKRMWTPTFQIHHGDHWY